ncbi:MAG TPA: twin-arginine translocation signal domain-containing protein, partial [Bacteroidota bacterium]|nr:twin-arginine translocation signal domain-containing protein [Bacteroidota bacterium]
MSLTRRTFLQNAAALGAGAAVTHSLPRAAAMTPSPGIPPPVVVSSANGLRAVTRAMELIREGSDALDAVLAGGNIVEN